MTESTDLKVRTPDDLVSEAIRENLSPDRLEKIIELAERWNAHAARDAYVRAMSEFRAEPIRLRKSGRAEFPTRQGGQAEYSFPKLPEILATVVPLLSRHGLSHQWITEQDQDGITVTCMIRHVDGHSEQTSLRAAADTTGSKNAIQAVGSTVTYLERYTFLALTGLAAGDQDDDAQTAVTKTLSDEQAETIERLIKETETDKAVFLAWLFPGEDEKAIADIPAGRFDECCGHLNRKKKRKGSS